MSAMKVTDGRSELPPRLENPLPQPGSCAVFYPKQVSFFRPLSLGQKRKSPRGRSTPMPEAEARLDLDLGLILGFGLGLGSGVGHREGSLAFAS